MDGIEGQHKAKRRESFLPTHRICPRVVFQLPPSVPALRIPRTTSNGTKSEISGKKISFMYEIGRADEGTQSMFCIQVSASVETWLEMLNGMRRRDLLAEGEVITQLWDVMSGD